MPTDRFEKSSGIRVLFIFFSWNFSRKTWIGHTNYGFARKAFYVSSGIFQGTFLSRNQNFGHRAEKYLFLANRYWQSCQNSFPCVQRNTLGKMNFSRWIIKFWNFFTFIKNFWILAELLAKNSNRSLSFQKSISKKTFSGEKYNLMIFFSDFQRKVWLAKKLFHESLEGNIRV